MSEQIAKKKRERKGGRKALDPEEKKLRRAETRKKSARKAKDICIQNAEDSTVKGQWLATSTK